MIPYKIDKSDQLSGIASDDQPAVWRHSMIQWDFSIHSIYYLLLLIYYLIINYLYFLFSGD